MGRAIRFRLRGGARHTLQELDRLLDDAYGVPEADLNNKDEPLDEAVYIVLNRSELSDQSRSLQAGMGGPPGNFSVVGPACSSAAGQGCRSTSRRGPPRTEGSNNQEVADDREERSGKLLAGRSTWHGRRRSGALPDSVARSVMESCALRAPVQPWQGRVSGRQ